MPGDLGDSLLNMWILGWGAQNLPRVVTGQMSIGDFWNANIFHPEPLALSFSEHLVGQALQILPVYHLTANLILSYNLLFLSSFALSGIGMYLLVRDLLGERPGFSRAAFLAGLIYAFVPVRLVQIAHIQSLSSQWMPLALFGFHRFLVNGNYKALVGGSAALLMQNWSCGYYLIYFSPFVVLFVLHQTSALGRARDWRVWAAFGVAAIAVGVGTWPFLSLYLDAQRVHGFERSLGEVISYSPDLYGYLTASGYLRLWGQIVQVAPKPEGEMFLGFTPMALGVVAIVLTIWDLRRSVNPTDREPRWRRAVAAALLMLCLVQFAAFLLVLFTGGFVTSLAGIPLRASNAVRLFVQAIVAVGLVMIVSKRVRPSIVAGLRSITFIAAMLTLLAVILSLGPIPVAGGRPISGLGLYRFLYEAVPGVAGLRVPGRMAMITALFLSVLAGHGAAQMQRRWKAGTSIVMILTIFFAIEAFAVPIPVNSTWGNSVIPPDRVYPAAAAPAVYRAAAELPASAVITEFPFGDAAWDLRYVYYSTVHWKRLVNGYSGAFPRSYGGRSVRLHRFASDPSTAWQALREAGTTHVIVHEAGLLPGNAAPLEQWLVASGARELGRFETDVLYVLPE